MDIEIEKLRLERARYRTELLKWVVIAVGAAVSFAVIDYGKLNLERSRAAAEDRRELLNAYLRATESPEPDVWRRKLHLIINSKQDAAATAWARAELDYVNRFAALDTLYRETLKIASQLVEPSRLNEPDRVQARARYNQLYWADLPYAQESVEVSSAMIQFRNQLLTAEEKGAQGREEWEELNRRLIRLSQALRDSSPSRMVETAEGRAKSP